MASRYLTGKRGEALLASEEIVGLAKDVLASEQFERAMQLSIAVVSSKSRAREALSELMVLVAPPPKRPLYYAQDEIMYLPRWTRTTIKYLGDYLDLLTKHLAYHVTKSNKLKESSFGPNLKAIQKTKTVPEDLIDKLRRYNSFLYRPGKHDFKLPSDRKGHRFTSKEVILTAFVTMTLASEIKEITNCLPDLNCHYESDIPE